MSHALFSCFCLFCRFLSYFWFTFQFHIYGSSASMLICVRMHTWTHVHILPSERLLSFMCHKIDKQLTVKQILIQGVQNRVWETRFLTCFKFRMCRCAHMHSEKQVQSMKRLPSWHLPRLHYGQGGPLHRVSNTNFILCHSASLSERSVHFVISVWRSLPIIWHTSGTFYTPGTVVSTCLRRAHPLFRRR